MTRKIFSKKVISISAKCSDLFSAKLYEDKEPIGKEYDGYVPDFMPGEHYGDYVMLDIDIESGRILNWKGITKLELKKTFSV